MRSVAILSGVSTHLDHLGVLSAILEIPLIVTEETTYQLAKRYYPFCDVQLYEPSDLSLEHLAMTYDVIFETGRFFATELASVFKLLYGKQMRFVFCPHGHSDKGSGQQELAKQDIALIYGPSHRALLTQTGSLHKTHCIIETGNYRLPFYLKNKSFYDTLVQPFIDFKRELPIALYAPTWDAKEAPSSFFTSTCAIIEELANDLNLLIKLHPYLFEQYPAHTIALMGRYENHPSVHFLNDFPPIYPLLDKCALYIGDHSSIGYDFLAYDRPLFFLLSDGPATALHQCGTTIQSLTTLKQVVLNSFDSYSQTRRKTYAHAFAASPSFEDLRNHIYCSINGPLSKLRFCRFSDSFEPSF